MTNKHLLAAIICVILCCCILCGCAVSGLSTTAVLASSVKTENPEDSTADTEEASEDSTSDPAGIIADISTVQAFTDEPVSDDDIEAIVMAGVNAPSSMNGQPWHFSVVTDPDVIQEFESGMSFGKPDGDFAGFGDGMPFEMPEDGGKFDMKVPDDMPQDWSPDMKAPDGIPQGGKPDMKAPDDMSQGDKGPSDMPAIPTGSGAKAGIGDAPLVIIVSCKPGSELDAGLATQNMSAEAQLLGYGTKILSSPTMALNGEKQDEYKELLGIHEDMSAVCVLIIGKTDEENFDIVSGATERNPADDVVTYLR